MALPSAALPLSADRPISTPYLLVIRADEQFALLLERSPFTVGRKPDKDLSIPDQRISRDHAVIIHEGDDFYVEDQGSKLGTYVNGVRISARHKLNRNDHIDFGPAEVAHVVFFPEKVKPATADHTVVESDTRELLSQISEMKTTTEAADLERLSLFLEAARKLNTARVLDEILVTLVEATLRLTHAERGFVFLRARDGRLRLTAGLDAKGNTLIEDSTISHSILNRAVNSGSEFLVTDTSASAELAGQVSIVAFDLRTVICIPLLRHVDGGNQVGGALYLDSKRASREMSSVSHDLLRTIARQAAALVENAELVQEQERARRYEQELAISGSIQRRLMTVRIPDTSFAQVNARNLSCKEIGGDFFDLVKSGECLTAIVADVCGKGVTAALLASILQGMIYAQLQSGVALDEIASVANRFLCQKDLGEKYATLVIARLSPAGRMELINCGHVPPYIIRGSEVCRTEPRNPPVGLLPGISYNTDILELAAGERLVIVTDGITEAQEAGGEFFGDTRLQEALVSGSFEEIFARVQAFCGETPFNDDCTVLELKYEPRTA
jgi:sigma-B regulation protein RsbU (phosphoserine phosphatase)